MILVQAPTVGQSAGHGTKPADAVQPPAAVIGSSFDHVDELLAEPGPQDRPDMVAAETAGNLDSAEEVAELPAAPGREIHASSSLNRWLALGVGSLVGVTLAVGGLGYGLARINSPRTTAIARSEPISPVDSQDSGLTADSWPVRVDQVREDVPASAPDSATASPRDQSENESSRGDVEAIDMPPRQTTSADSDALVQTNPQATHPAAPPEFVSSDPAPHTVRRVPAGLEGFADLLEDAPQQPDYVAETEQDDGNALDDVEANVGAADVETTGDTAPEVAAVERTQPYTIDVEARLADALHRVDFRALPLVDFLRTVTQLSTIPIELDPEGLAYVNLKPDTPVTLQQTDTSVAQLLDAALRPLKMTYVAHSDHVVVTSASIARDDLTTHTFRVADLTGGDGGQQVLLGRWLVQFVEPATWEGHGGAGKLELADGALRITQARRVQFHVLMFLERLRRARGLRLQSSIGEARVPLATGWSRLSANLDQHVTIKVWYPEPLLSVVTRFEQAAKIRMLIDWGALAVAGFSPETEVALVADGKPVGTALGQLLDPLQLTYRPIDERTIQITTSEAAAMRGDIEFYSLKELGSDPVRRIKQTIARSSGVGDFAIDEAVRMAIVSLPSSLHRQLLSE